MKLNNTHYQIIHDCEKKYGSLGNTPDHLLKPLWDDLYEDDRANTGNPHYQDAELDSMRQKVCQMARDGYPCAEIERHVTISHSTVIKYIREAGITTKRWFKYLIVSPDGVNYYTTAKKTAYQKLLHGKAKENKAINRALKRHGYSVVDNLQKVWADIPEGDYYVTPNGLFKKHGDENYER